MGAIFALLLHRWLLLRPEAGGLEQRQKHVHVLMLGAIVVGWLGPHGQFARRPMFSLPATSRHNHLTQAAVSFPWET